VPELFHHQHTFIGCLSVRRFQNPDTGSEQVLLATQAFDAGLSEECPALDGERRCSIQDQRKPAICRVVPFDALLPDRLQHLVLAGRAAEAHYLGSDCISAGKRSGLPVVTRHLSVVDEHARTALLQRRRDLAEERRFWGDAVLKMLHAELLSQPAQLARVPLGGFLGLSIAPVLMVLADASPRSRERCMVFLDAQALLCERTLQAARDRGREGHATTRQLRAFCATNARLRALLAAAPPPLTILPASERTALEHWLGIA
jgi:hypothetical protein